MAETTLPAVTDELLNKRLPIAPREMETGSNKSGQLSKPTWRKASAAGWGILFAFFVVFGGWAIVAPLASAVRAPGELRVVSEQQVIQHLEGGIVDELFVREGDTVKKGEVLARLNPLQTSSQYARFRNQLYAVMAERARLEAVRDEKSAIDFPERLLKESDDPEVARLLKLERNVFEADLRSLSNVQQLIQERIAQLQSEIEGSRTRLASTIAQMDIIEDELEGVRALFERGLERKPRVLALERAKEQLRGLAGQLEASIAQGQLAIGEQELRRAAIESEYKDKTAAALRENSVRMEDLRNNEPIWRDKIERIEIKSPINGQIVDMRVTTEGGVVGPGEVLMTVVPTDDVLIAVVKVKPKDVDALLVGTPVQLMLSAFNPRITPPIDGIMTSYSLDAVSDNRGQEFFEARVQIDQESLRINIPNATLTAGMQVSALIAVGERTLFDYWMTPLTASLKQAMREP